MPLNATLTSFCFFVFCFLFFELSLSLCLRSLCRQILTEYIRKHDTRTESKSLTVMSSLMFEQYQFWDLFSDFDPCLHISFCFCQMVGDDFCVAE